MALTGDVRPATAIGRIFLIGLMGSGKTTVGTRLAELFGCEYLDNDTMLQRMAGATAETLAVAAGAGVLHQNESMQHRALSELMPPFVASIAASVGDRPDDLALLAATGTVVYLRARPRTLADRLGAGEGRPWLREDPASVIYRMFDARDAAYRASAAIVINCDNLEPEAVAQRVVQRLRIPIA